MKNKENKLFFSGPEVAEIMNVSRATIATKIRKGIIKAEKIGRNYAIPREEIEQFLDGGKSLSEQSKKEIKNSVDRTIKEYGQAIRMLGKE